MKKQFKTLCVLSGAILIFCMLCGCSLFSSDLSADTEPQVQAAETTAPPSPSLSPTPTPSPVPEVNTLPESTATPEPMSPPQEAIMASQTSLITDQIVLVVDHNLTLWERNEQDVWECKMDTYCGYGSNGLADADTRTEGSKTTPIGSFPLSFAFGTGSNPGTEMDYRQITSDSYWSAQDDGTYNTWVESSTYMTGEHLIDYYQYEYALAVGFNADPVVYGRGSAIFVHCKSYDHWSTAGCVSLEESDMINLMLSLRNGAYIIIVPQLSDVAMY